MRIHKTRGHVRKALAVASLAGVLAGASGCVEEPAAPGSSSASSPSSGASSSTAKPSAAQTTAGALWLPKVGASFQIQYSGEIDLTVPVDIYNLDWESTTAEEITQLSGRGVSAMCYFNAGAYEEWRSDRDQFPAEVLGNDLDDWPGEKWLDVRAIDALMPIMTARMDVCKAKGFRAVDPDNTDGWIQDTGFDIAPSDQVAYQRALAKAAHARGLSIGLKNNPDQLGELAGDVDFAVNEECVRYRECDKYANFLASGKAVFNIEYSGSLTRVCPGRPAGMTTVIKDRKLSAKLQTC